MRRLVRRALCGAALVASLGAQADDCPRALLMGVPAAKPDTPLDQLLFTMKDRLGDRARVRIDMVVMTRMRSYLEFRAGRTTLYPMASRSPERDEFAWLIPQGKYKATLLMSKARGVTPGSRDDLLAKGMNITFIRGQQFGERANSLVAELATAGKLQMVSDPLAAIRMLKAGRTDAVFGLPLFFESALRTEAWLDETDVVDADLGDPVDFGAYISQTVPRACYDRLAKAARELRAAGVYHDLLKALFPEKLRYGITF